MNHDENDSGFISHLAELRKRLINSFIFLIIFFVACYFFAEHIYGFLVEPFATAVKNDGSDRRNIFNISKSLFFYSIFCNMPLHINANMEVHRTRSLQT